MIFSSNATFDQFFENISFIYSPIYSVKCFRYSRKFQCAINGGKGWGGGGNKTRFDVSNC